jgi:NHL repeat
MKTPYRLFFLFCFLFIAIGKPVDGQIINTFAGGATSGGPGDNGPATLARMYTPSGICLDRFHNVYISDQNDCRIRLVDTTGIITTVAGNGHPGYSGDGGPADSAQLNYPEGVAVDALGNIYIADQFNNVIRKVVEGVIYTIGGNNTIGDSGDGGPATNAMLWHPNDVAVDRNGNVYFVDQDNSRMKQIDTAGILHNLVGTGVAGYNGDGIAGDTAQLNFPAGIAVDTSGNVYIADLYNHRVRKYDITTGIITTVAGSDTSGFCGDGGPATAACLTDPTAVMVDRYGNIYFTDYYNFRIRKVDSAGNISTLAGSATPGFGGDGGPATDAQLNYPQGVTADDSGTVYLADYENGRARVVEKGIPLQTASTVARSVVPFAHPNPSMEAWYLKNVAPELTRDDMTLTDIRGAAVPFRYDTETRRIDPGIIANGIYILRLSAGKTTSTIRLVRLSGN